MALDVLQVKQCPPVELPHLKCPSRVTALRAAVGGQRCEGCISSWSDAGDETLSFPTKKTCSKDHNHWAKPTLRHEPWRVTFSLSAFHRGLGLHTSDHKTAPWFYKAPSTIGQHLPTDASTTQRRDDKPVT